MIVIIIIMSWVGGGKYNLRNEKLQLDINHDYS